MSYWLIKSEPQDYSWEDLCQEKETVWDGVKNHQALGNMKKMKLGDLGFFYHSQTERSIVGTVECSREFYHHDEYGDVVNFQFHSQVKQKVTLKHIKDHPVLRNMTTVRQPRLSVSPVSREEWQILIKMLN